MNIKSKKRVLITYAIIGSIGVCASLCVLYLLAPVSYWKFTAKIFPHNEQVRTSLANSLLEEATYSYTEEDFDVAMLKAAIKEYRKVTNGNTNMAEAHLGLGKALSASGDKEAAQIEWEKAVAVDPKLPEAHWWLGVLAEEQKDYDLAIKHFQAAYTLEPSRSSYREKLWDTQKAEEKR